MTEKTFLTKNIKNCNDNSIPLNENDESDGMNLLKFSELTVKYPELQNVLEWSEEDLKTFYEGKLLLGKQQMADNGERELLISEESLIRLMDYHKSLDDLKKDFEKPED